MKENYGITFRGMWKSTNFNFATFICNLFRFNHLHIFCISSLIESCISATVSPNDSTVAFSVVSSAYKIKLNLSLDMIISFINILNKRGPTIEPCGTPVLINTIEEIISSICT